MLCCMLFYELWIDRIIDSIEFTVLVHVVSDKLWSERQQGLFIYSKVCL